MPICPLTTSNTVILVKTGVSVIGRAPLTFGCGQFALLDQGVEGESDGHGQDRKDKIQQGGRASVSRRQRLRTHRLIKRLFQMRFSSSSRLAAILSLILSSQPNILIILRAPMAAVSSVHHRRRTFRDAVDADIGLSSAIVPRTATHG